MNKEKSKFLDQFTPHFQKVNEELEKVMDSKIPLIREARRYILLFGGKRLRPLFFLLSCELCNYRKTDVYALSAIFECLHTASLLHDDVLDNATLRRGKSSANQVWGNSVAVLIGDYLFSKSSGIALKKKHSGFLKLLAETSTKMTEGQILEHLNTHNWNIEKREYISIITFKTASLISAACAGGGIVAGAKENYVGALENYGLNMGIAFQIIDDIMDYTSNVEVTGKTPGKDLREGKITLPLIYALSSMEQGERERLELLFKNGKASNSDYSDLINFVRKNGTINRCKKDARDFISLAEKHLDCFPESPAKDAFSGLNSFILNRGR